ncbi:uncharacterized protein LOC144159042 [Haemaphysalis longicornis]
MPGPKINSALLLACLTALAVGSSGQRQSNFVTMVQCLSRNVGSVMSTLCAGQQLLSADIERDSANCTNCDRYFICVGNSRAMSECGNSRAAREGAERASYCIETAGVEGAHRGGDQEASRYGLEGGDCAHRYLAAVQCAYNPDTKRCG